METRRIQSALLAMALAFGVSQVAAGGHLESHAGAKVTLERQKGDHRAVIRLRSHEPFFGFPPAGFIYGGPPYYAPPYLPYPYNPPYHPYASRASQGPERHAGSGQHVIPAGRLALLVDPVSAEVFVDGVRLTRRNDLSYGVALLEGSHRIEARADGFAPYSEVIDVPGGQQVVLTIRLDKQP